MSDPSTKDGLTDKQQRFVEEYVVDCNATQAAIRAGYAPTSAADTGYENLRKPEIRAAVAARLEKLSQDAAARSLRVLEEYAAIAFSDIGDMIDFAGDQLSLRPPSEISERARRAIASVKVKRVFEGHGDEKVPVDLIEFRLWPKEAALEKLGKHLKLFKETVEHSGPGGGPIQITSVNVVRPDAKPDGSNP